MKTDWIRLGDRLPGVGQPILLATWDDSRKIWRVRDALLLIRHEGVCPDVSDFEREDGLPRNWWFNAIYGSDLRLARPEHRWAAMPSPDMDGSTTAAIARTGHIERLKMLQKRAASNAEAEQAAGRTYHARDRRREAESLEWALKELDR